MVPCATRNSYVHLCFHASSEAPGPTPLPTLRWCRRFAFCLFQSAHAGESRVYKEVFAAPTCHSHVAIFHARIVCSSCQSGTPNVDAVLQPMRIESGFARAPRKVGVPHSVPYRHLRAVCFAVPSALMSRDSVNPATALGQSCSTPYSVPFVSIPKLPCLIYALSVLHIMFVVLIEPRDIILFVMARGLG